MKNTCIVVSVTKHDRPGLENMSKQYQGWWTNSLEVADALEARNHSCFHDARSDYNDRSCFTLEDNGRTCGVLGRALRIQLQVDRIMLEDLDAAIKELGSF